MAAAVALLLFASGCGGSSDADPAGSDTDSVDSDDPIDSEAQPGTDPTGDDEDEALDSATDPADPADPGSTDEGTAEDPSAESDFNPEDFGLSQLLSGLSEEEIVSILADLGLPGITVEDLDSLNLEDLNLDDLNLEQFGLGDIELDPDSFPDEGSGVADMATNPAILSMLQQMFGIDEEQSKCLAAQFEEMSSSNIDFEQLRDNDCGVDLTPFLPPG